jgi:hypothetical protein
MNDLIHFCFLLLLLLLLQTSLISCVVVNLRSTTPFDIQLDAARGLIKRVLNNSNKLANAFILEQLVLSDDIDEEEAVRDVFQLSDADKHDQCDENHCILIRGTSGVALSSGFYW